MGIEDVLRVGNAAACRDSSLSGRSAIGDARVGNSTISEASGRATVAYPLSTDRGGRLQSATCTKKFLSQGFAACSTAAGKRQRPAGGDVSMAEAAECEHTVE
jgi:hypothetical protein